MYSKKFLYNSVFNTPFTRPNLNLHVNVRNFDSSQYFVKCLHTLRGISYAEMNNNVNNFITKLKFLYKNGNMYEVLTKKLKSTPQTLKDQSTGIIRSWIEQCEYIVAQRFRRSQQMFCLYTRLWEERALRELLRRMKQQVSRRSKEFVFGAMGITAFNWENQRITEEELFSHVEEFDYVRLLKQKTIVCRKCSQRRLIDVMLPDIDYCRCPGSTGDIYSLDEWMPYIERQDLLVWRRQHEKNGGNYEYKVYGAYNDVTAEDFLQVQVDTGYRQHWDTTAVNLEVIDHDTTSNSDIIYWEMLWPRMFANRDYVYNRRYIIDPDQKMITIVSKSIVHPACPVKQDKHRVDDYQSCMVIRSNTELNQPGIEFTLTYFDDPGVNIPAAITSWVAMAAMPDFLNKLRHAAHEFSKQKDTLPPQNPAKDDDGKSDVNAVTVTTDSLEDSTAQSREYWRYIHPHYYMG